MHGFPTPPPHTKKCVKNNLPTRHLYPKKLLALKRGWKTLVSILSSLTISYLQTHVAPDELCWVNESWNHGRNFGKIYTSPRNFRTWQAGKSPFFMGDTSSTGCFFSQSCLFSGEYHQFGDVKPYRIAWKLGVSWFGIQQEKQNVCWWSLFFWVGGHLNE